MTFKLIRRSIAGKPFRFLLTCSAVTIGVMFTVGIFVLTEGLRSTFSDLAEDIGGTTQLAVRSEVEFGDRLILATPLDDDVVDLLNNIDGVVGVQPEIGAFQSIATDADGVVQSATFAPNIGINWPSEAVIPSLYIQQGRPPQSAAEFAMDTDAFAAGNFAVGSTYTVSNPGGIADFTLVGTFFFASPSENAAIGAKLLAFETATAREVLNFGSGYDQISFATERSADETAVAEAVRAALPEGVELVTGDELIAEQTNEFGEIITIFQTFLLVFAFVILAVSAFVIFNVFTIVIGQRIRELGLLRAIGASGRQVTTVLLGEALMVGVFATVVGTLLGIGFGWSLRFLLSQLDFLPSGNPLILQPATFIWAAVVGIGVTMASAVMPALRARRISPMAALREDARLSRQIPKPRLLIGSLTLALAWGATIYAITTDSWNNILFLGGLAAIGNAYGARRVLPQLGRYASLAFGLILMVVAFVFNLETVSVLSLVGLAALTIFLGINNISPLLARPMSHFLGRWPLAILLGCSGVLTTIAGAIATLGALGLVVWSAINLISGFTGAALGGLFGSLLLLPLALMILLIGIRGVDAAFIMGWKFWQVASGFALFLAGATGAWMFLNGIVSAITGEIGALIWVPVGAVVLAGVYFLRKLLPKTLKSNARMARENAGRSPRRSASAAAALMIGLALVTTVSVIATSFQSTIADVLRRSVTSDWFVSGAAGDGPNSAFSPLLAEALEEVDQIDTVVRYRFTDQAYITSFDEQVKDSTATDQQASLDHIDPNFAALDEDLLGRNSIWIHQDIATDHNFMLGSTFDVEFPDNSTEELVVAGIFTDSSVYGNQVISSALWEDKFPSSQVQFLSMTFKTDENGQKLSEEVSRTLLEPFIEAYPTLNVETPEEFQSRQTNQVDQFLRVIFALLGVAILIALLGIAITLSLSVFERTRELGLVRAVGMTTKQMLRMVLFEGAIIAAFGGVLGVLLGTAFGSAAVIAMPDAFISTLRIPLNSILLFLIVAATAGIAAAIVPARRAAKLNVLEAIAQA